MIKRAGLDYAEVLRCASHLASVVALYRNWYPFMSVGVETEEHQAIFFIMPRPDGEH